MPGNREGTPGSLGVDYGEETIMKRSWKTVLAVFAVLVIAALVALNISRHLGQDAPSGRATPPVKISKPTREVITDQLQYNGDVAAIQQANIYSKVSGTLEQVNVDIGDVVRKGELLAVIDSVELYQQTLETSATYQNNLLNYDRTKKLMDQNLLAQEDLDNAETALKISQANFELAKTKLSYAQITAPFSGYVTKRYVDPGASISTDNTMLFTLMDLTTVKVTINVLEKDTPIIPRLQKAVIVADALPDMKFEGRIARYSQAVDLATRTMAVEIDVPNTDLLLKPGMFVTATLVISVHPDAITVPTAAILSDAQGTFVYVVVDDAAKRTPVQVGIEQDNRTQIIGGLSGTENVVTTGQQLIRDGAKVKVES